MLATTPAVQVMEPRPFASVNVLVEHAAAGPLTVTESRRSGCGWPPETARTTSGWENCVLEGTVWCAGSRCIFSRAFVYPPNTIRHGTREQQR